MFGIDLKEVVAYVVTAIILPFVVTWLKNKSAAANATAMSNKLDAKGKLMAHLEGWLTGAAAAVAEKKFPGLAAEIVAGNITNKPAVKAELQEWGQALKDEAIKHFAAQKVDVVKHLGEEAIDKLIEITANKVSPFPGMETANAILKTGVAYVLLDKGVHYVKEKAAALECKACIPPCSECPLKGLEQQDKAR